MYKAAAEQSQLSPGPHSIRLAVKVYKAGPLLLFSCVSRNSTNISLYQFSLSDLQSCRTLPTIISSAPMLSNMPIQGTMKLRQHPATGTWQLHPRHEVIQQRHELAAQLHQTAISQARMSTCLVRSTAKTTVLVKGMTHSAARLSQRALKRASLALVKDCPNCDWKRSQIYPQIATGLSRLRVVNTPVLSPLTCKFPSPITSKIFAPVTDYHSDDPCSLLDQPKPKLASHLGSHRIAHDELVAATAETANPEAVGVAVPESEKGTESEGAAELA